MSRSDRRPFGIPTTRTKRHRQPDHQCQPTKRLQSQGSNSTTLSSSFALYERPADTLKEGSKDSIGSDGEHAKPELGTRDKGKGKMKVVYLPELPQDVWTRIFEIYYEDRTNEWQTTGALRDGLTPLLISRDHARFAIPVLYRHPYIGYKAIDPFIASVQKPTRYTGLPKLDYIKHLTVRPSPVIPSIEFALHYSSKLTCAPDGQSPLTPFTVHTSFVKLLALLPELSTLVLKDTLVLHQADAAVLFDGLKLIQPKKARLEIRMWDIYDSPYGQDIIGGTAGGVHTSYNGRPSPPSANDRAPYHQFIGLDCRNVQREWRDALYNGNEIDLPGWWVEPSSPDPLAPPTVQLHPNMMPLQQFGSTQATVGYAHGHYAHHNTAILGLSASYSAQTQRPTEPDTAADASHTFDMETVDDGSVSDPEDDLQSIEDSPEQDDESRRDSASTLFTSTALRTGVEPDVSSGSAGPALLGWDSGSAPLGGTSRQTDYASSSASADYHAYRMSVLSLRRSQHRNDTGSAAHIASRSGTGATVPPPIPGRVTRSSTSSRVNYLTGAGGVHLAPHRGLVSSSLAHHMRGLLLSLITAQWTPRLQAFSFVAHDPLASLIVRAPQLDFWTQIAVPHIRVHLPRGCNSLAVFKGSKEVARDRARRRNQQPGQEEDAGQIVGGDGLGGELIHEDVRLFEVEINTLAEMRDDVWIRSGSQLPPQLCRILAGEHDWREVGFGHTNDTFSPPYSEYIPPNSPATDEFDSPTFSFVSLTTEGSSIDDLDLDEGGEGDTYDKAKAEEQAKRSEL